VRTGGTLILLAALISGPAFSQAAPPVAPENPPIVSTASPLDTPAQAAAKRLPKVWVNQTPQRFSAADKARVDVVTRLDEILIYGQVEPEDYSGPRKSPMMQFRDRLERDRPMTPKEKAQLALCFIGLCGIYGPDGAPIEPSLDARSEARLNQSTTQLNSQFKGTLQ
jgi:hypothetical protein